MKLTRRYAITHRRVSYEVVLTLDVDAIARDMVNKAVRNPSGKATMMYGSIKAEVVKKEPA